MQLSIVIVNWKSSDFLRACIASIESQLGNVGYEVIVVDNASEPLACSEIAKFFHQVTVISLSSNVGFSRANNVGFENSSGEYVLFLNPDTVVHADAVQRMMEALGSESSIGAVGCRLLNGDGSLQTSSVQPFPTVMNQTLTTDWLLRHFGRLSLWGVRALYAQPSELPVTVEVISGACIMLKRAVFESVGRFSTDYFMYAEDTDLCYKIAQAGWRVCYAGMAVVTHFGGQSSNQKETGFSDVVMHESTFRMLRKFRGSAYAYVYRTMMLLNAIARLVFTSPFVLAQRSAAKRSMRKWSRIAGWCLGHHSQLYPTAEPSRQPQAAFPNAWENRTATAKYIIVTPVRNEEQHISATINCVVGQTVTPAEWIIVDDGSTDRTADVVAEYCRNHPWIRLLNSPGGTRARGGRVVQLVLKGIDAARTSDYEYLVKLDGDVSFEPTFFERIFREFNSTPNLGISSGISFTYVNGTLVQEKGAEGHTLGATKVYKRECYERIGGLIPSMGWDGLDEIKARMMGWTAKPIADLVVLHHRPEGQGQGLFRSGIERGKGSHFMGYHPVFLLARAARQMLRPNSFADGVGMLIGYLGSALRRDSRVPDAQLVRYIRRNQIRKLFMLRSEL